MVQSASMEVEMVESVKFLGINIAVHTNAPGKKGINVFSFIRD